MVTPAAIPPSRAADDVIGEDGQVVRAFNFSGGGFNTVMQLGVTQALLVTQGKAPDIVVGVSAGAIQATALADVLRRGAISPASSTAQCEQALLARVSRFREIVESCYRAPEDLVDALLPDAYQIESLEPLKPLEQPILNETERTERRQWLQTKAGLANLYNALLGLDIPVGTATRMVRRFLGFRAIGSLGRARGWSMAKPIAVVTELMKSWLLITENLRRFAPLVPLLVWPLLASLYQPHRKGVNRDADSIMFRFSVVERAAALHGFVTSFLFLLNVWAVVTFVLLLPFLVVGAQLAIPNDPGVPDVSSVWVVALLIECVLIVSPLFPSVRRLDLVAFRSAAKDLIQGLSVFLLNVVKWGLTLMALTALPVALIAAVMRSNVLGDNDIAVTWILWALSGTLLFGSSLAVCAFVALGVYRLKRTRWWRGALLQTARLATIVVVATLLVSLVLVTTLDIYVVLPFIANVLGLSSVLNDWLAAVTTNGPLLTLDSLEGLARAGDLTWPQRALLDVCIAIVVIVTSLAAAMLLVIVSLVWIVGSYVARSDRGSWFVNRFLARFDLSASIADAYPLKRFFVQLFDRDYYGRVLLKDAANSALADGGRASSDARAPTKTRVVDYAIDDAAAGRPRIRLALAAANILDGKLEVLDENYPIVDALLAACAIPPILPPKQLGDSWYTDAINIGNVSTRALLRLLRRPKYKLAKISGVHIYAANPLPVSQRELSPPIDANGRQKDTAYLNLIDIAVRALQLERFRDAKVERRLTKIFTDVLPVATPVREVVTRNGAPKRYFRMFVAPVELDRPTNLNNRILFAPKEERRAEIVRTVAMGCRAALQVMLAETLASPEAQAAAHEAEPGQGSPGQRFVSCATAVSLYKARHGGSLVVPVPGCGADAPGLAEICKHCEIRDERGRVLTVEKAGVKIRAEKSLRLLGDAIPEEIRDWPPERAGKEQVSTRVFSYPSHDKNEGEDRPGKVCLFGGGVFRGVFQMGVLNALALADFKPTIFAGASVGSITAAMSAAVLVNPDKPARLRAVAELASVYLAIDRLVLTDRFADFIRTWTIRASEARFSVRDADRVFRKYDFDNAPVFQHTARAVAAGLERLFYVSPYHLNEIVSAGRRRQARKLVDLLKASAQNWLDRMGVGTEVLGAEPLRSLILEFVVTKLSGSEDMTMDGLSPDMRLIATTTNLTRGALRVLGSTEELGLSEDDVHKPITLVEALLASSAFPGVFRPRRSGDLLLGAKSEHEYVDGGIVDNLPLDPVLEELRAQAKQDSRTRIRPTTPHLMLAASLEPHYLALSNAGTVPMTASWPDLRTRMRELQYNVKLDMYESGLRNVTDLYDSLTTEERQEVRAPLYVKLIAIKPEWLCSTFAFHPMLGFSRRHQAKSIAHGCAATLCSLASIKSESQSWRRDLAQWGLEANAIPNVKSLRDAKPPRGRDGRAEFERGNCWLLRGTPCPFSSVSTKDIPDFANSRRWVAQIHRHCWESKTHTRDALTQGAGPMSIE